jgi:N-acetylmuramoyl-L-alanine amidase
VRDSGVSEVGYTIQERVVNESVRKRRISLGTVQNKSLSAYARPSVKIHGKGLSVRGFIIGDTSYVPFRAAADALGASYSYNSSTRTGTMKLGGLTLTASSGCYVAYANGRALFTMTPTVIMSDGRIYIPTEVLAKSTGLLLMESESLITIGGTYKPLVSAERFYREDEVLWLARIIHAESGGEPLLGQIAVGGVVMNRVKSSMYPNTIYSVIFDRKYGVQFSPILNGTIYNTPSYNSLLAAKICLEGVDVTGGALFFLHPELAASSWIPKNREYLFTVGRHDFYK